MGASSSRSRSNQGKSQNSKGTFKWRIDGFSSLLEKDEGWTYSRVFEIMGFNWFLKLNPMDRKSGDETEYVSLRLDLDQTSVKIGRVVETSFKFLIYEQSYGNHHKQKVSHNFQTASTSSGTSCMIPLATLKDQSSGFLVNDSCIFGVDFIKVVAAKANDTSEMLYVQKMNTTFNDDPEVYTWDIEDFFALKSPEYSPEFEIGGHKWLIIIFPSGNDKSIGNNGNYLSLYLKMKMADTLHQNSAKLVEFSVCIKDQETDQHWKLAGRSTFSQNAIEWGWDKFMSLETFKDSSNGYLVKTKCCIEVQAAIIGTSKMA